MKVLVADKFEKSGVQGLQASGCEVQLQPELKEESLTAEIRNGGAEVLVVRSTKVTDEMLGAGNLKLVVRAGADYNTIDIAAASSRGVQVANCPGKNAIAVAEHVLFMLLNIAKRKSMYDDSVKSGNFSNRNKLPKTIEIWNKNILIAGFGRIGQCLIKRCKGFEMNVFVYDPFVSKEVVESLGGIKVENLEDSIKNMDAVSLHVPLNDKTKNLINYNLLRTMKKNCIIINAARGGVINEIDLDRALNENLIFGAGLDVFEKEPPDQNNPLLKNKKVFLSPHTAAFTEECMVRMGKETIQNIIDFFEKKLDKSKTIKL